MALLLTQSAIDSGVFYVGGKKSVMNSILLDVYLLDTFVPGQNASNGQGHSLYAILPSVQILYPMVLRHLDFPFVCLFVFSHSPFPFFLRGGFYI